MRISNPEWDNGFFMFDCPCGNGEKLRLPVGDGEHEWRVTGELLNVTIRPSVHVVGHQHFFVTNGEIHAC